MAFCQPTSTLGSPRPWLTRWRFSGRFRSGRFGRPLVVEARAFGVLRHARQLVQLLVRALCE